MVLNATKCGSCGNLASRDIRINRFGVPFWSCPHCGVIQEDRSWYRYLNQEEAGDIIEARQPRGLFVQDTGIEVIGIDNSTGDAWVEEFPDTCGCLRWLARENKEM